VSTRRKSQSRRPESAAEVEPQREITIFLALASEILAAADECIDPPNASTPRGNIEQHILLRGTAALRAARLLIANDEWEFAAAPTRQLFELVLNMEYISQSEQDIDLVAKFFIFGRLQNILNAEKRYQYERDSGRLVDPTKLSDIHRQLSESHFDDFRLPTKDGGSPKWRKSWNAKNIADMSRESTNSHRAKQYQQLYGIWSEQAHGSPGALYLQWVSHHSEHSPTEVRQWVRSRTLEALGMAMTLFIELWVALPNVTRPTDTQIHRWFDVQRKTAGPYIKSEFSPYEK
jgi:hypothetical protein